MKVTKYIDKKQWLILPMLGFDLREKSLYIGWFCIVLAIDWKRK